MNKITSRDQLVVLQHPSEVKHGKNSVRLLPLALDFVRVAVGECADDFVDIRQWLSQQNKPVYLLYPSETSIDVGTAKQSTASILIVLDGTWRKVHKMLQLNPWLYELPQLHISPDKPSQYRIRKAKRSDSLSSLEAAAYGLQALEPELNIEPLFTLFDAMITQQINAMPPDVRRRYEPES
ncbi:DTW domain-containing protein [Parashewanella spongiae]|nr:DTW domain-containing protein [Parashewanella spongiae]